MYFSVWVPAACLVGLSKGMTEENVADFEAFLEKPVGIMRGIKLFINVFLPIDAFEVKTLGPEGNVTIARRK